MFLVHFYAWVSIAGIDVCTIEMTGRWFTNSFLIIIHGKSLNAQIIPGSPVGKWRVLSGFYSKA